MFDVLSVILKVKMTAVLKQFVAQKKTWRRGQAKLPFAQKVRIVEKLRDNAKTFRKVRKLQRAA